MDRRRYIGPPACVEIRGPRFKSFMPGDEVDFDAELVPGQTWGQAVERAANLFAPIAPENEAAADLETIGNVSAARVEPIAQE